MAPKKNDTKKTSPVQVGIWVPPGLQGNALKLEQKVDFKKCVMAEIDKYIDLSRGVKKFGSDWIESKMFDSKSDAELYLDTREFLEECCLDGHQVGIHKTPLSSFCVPPDDGGDPDPVWAKFRVYQMFWRTESDGLINWTTDAAAVRFEELRKERLYGTRLRDEVCGIPICAFVKTGIPLD